MKKVAADKPADVCHQRGVGEITSDIYYTQKKLQGQ